MRDKENFNKKRDECHRKPEIIEWRAALSAQGEKSWILVKAPQVDKDFIRLLDYTRFFCGLGLPVPDRVILLGLDIKMFYGGPKEAVMHGIYRQNFGFTDIVIGRKHADAPYHDGSSIWGDFDAHLEQMRAHLDALPRVDIAYAYAGSDGSAMRAFIASRSSILLMKFT